MDFFFFSPRVAAKVFFLPFDVDVVLGVGPWRDDDEVEDDDNGASSSSISGGKSST